MACQLFFYLRTRRLRDRVAFRLTHMPLEKLMGWQAQRCHLPLATKGTNNTEPRAIRILFAESCRIRKSWVELS